MTYKQIIEDIIETCKPLALYPESVYDTAFEALLYDVLHNNEVSISDDTCCADGAEVGTSVIG